MGSASLLGGALAATWLPALPALAAEDRYNSRELFDRIDTEFRARGGVGQAYDTNEQGNLAWYQTYFLQGYLAMYETWKDTHYLDRLVGNVEQILAGRDSERGVVDYRGLSLPAWRALDPFTVAHADLNDTTGRPLLRVRVARSYSNEKTTSVTVTPGSTADLFTLSVTNELFGFTDTFADISLDPNSPAYAVRRVYDAFPLFQGRSLWVTVEDLRPSPADGDRPADGRTAVTPQPLIFGVHTGILVGPMARFVRLVKEDPRLRSRYQHSATVVRQAVEDALAVHEPELTDLPDGSLAYRWLKGAPISFDGCTVPTNQKDALTGAYAELARATGKDLHRRTAERLLRSTRSELVLADDGAFTWSYYPTYSQPYRGYERTGSPETDVSIHVPRYGGQRIAEDVGHAAISVDAAVSGTEAGIVFGDADMRAFAATLRERVFTTVDGRASAYGYVDGSGPAGLASQLHSSGMWLRLAPWAPDIADRVHAIYRDNGLDRSAVGIALLNWATRL